MKQTLEKRIILFSFVILSMTILANTCIDIAVFRKDFIQEKLLRSQSLGTALKSNIEKVLALGLEIRDINGLTDKCREVVQSDPEIAYCVITDKDSKPIFTSETFYATLDFSAAEKGPSESDSKDIRAIVINTPKGVYHNTATPVRSFDGKPVAVIHLGFPQSSIDQKLHGIIVRSFLVLCVSFLVSFALVVFFVKRSIVAPVSRILEGLTRISQGNFSAPIQELPMYELNELGANINIMSTALATRDAELRKSYEELSLTHSQLQDSYIKLEKLSLDLEKSEELYKKMLEEAGDAIIILDNSETVIIANKMTEDFFGYSATEVIGQHISSLLLMLRAENIPHLLQTFHSAFGEAYVAEELSIINRQDKALIGRIHASSISLGDRNLLQVIIRDVTKEREILANLEQSAEGLSRLNKMKDSFLGLASHELKTPLTVIMGYTELLLTDIREQLTETTAEMVQNIAGAASRLDSIIKDMVDVSMIDQKRLDLKLEKVDINALLEATIRELRFFFALRKQEITTDLDKSIPAIKGDQTRLMQLLSNVIGNAIKFTPDGGTITVTTCVRQLMKSAQTTIIDSNLSLNIVKKPQCYIEIIISDNGIGIDQEDQSRIFDKFYEAGSIEEHSSGKVAFKSRGTGLGLSIAKGVVEMHGGEIWVESPGYNPQTCPGSSFFILLPMNPLSGEGSLEFRDVPD